MLYDKMLPSCYGTLVEALRTTIRLEFRVLTDLFYMHATIRQKYMVFFHLIFLFCTTIRPKIRVLIGLFFYVHATIRPKYMVLFHLFFLLNTTIRPKIKVHIDLFLLFVHDHSTKIHGPHWFTFSMCTRPFGKNIWSSFINSFFCARPFDQKLRCTLIYFFICTRPFDQKLGSSLIYFFLFAHDLST